MQENISLTIITNNHANAVKIVEVLCEYCKGMNEDRFIFWSDQFRIADNTINNDSLVHMYYFDYEGMEEDLFETIAEKLPDIEFEGTCIYESDDGDSPSKFEKIYRDGVLYKALKKGKLQLISCNKEFSGEFIMDDNVSEICDGAFTNCELLDWIYVSDSVKKLGKDTFAGCENLCEAHIPASVQKIIGKTVFKGCPKLTIYAPAGSCAESYAKANNIPFVCEAADAGIKDASDYIAANRSLFMDCTEPKAGSMLSGIEFEGKNFVLTGLDSMDEQIVSAIIVSRGGVIKSSTVLKTDYLIFNPTYGRQTKKYLRAQELIKTGKNIVIIPVEKFIKTYS